MAFIDPFDPATPSDLADVSQGDDRIRELKRALSERLSQVIAGWPDTDPLKLKSAELDSAGGTAATIGHGTEAAKPNPATFDFYYADDVNKLFVKEGTAYNEIVAGGGGAAADVSYLGLRKKTLTASLTQGPLLYGAPGPRYWYVMSGTAFAAADNDHLFLSAKVRIKKATEGAFNTKYNVHGEEVVLTLDWPNAQNPADDVTATIVAVGSELVGANVTWSALVEVLLQSGANGATVNLEMTMYLLAMTATAAADA